MALPFSFTYTIINNILTIVFDFSSMSYGDFQNLKKDYFGQGLVLNESGFDMAFHGLPRKQTYAIPVARFGNSPIRLRLMGRKVRENNQDEHVIKIHTVADYQEIIDDCEVLLRKAQDNLDDLHAMAGKWVGNSTAKGMSKREAKYKSEIHSNTVALRYLRKLQAQITTPKS